MRPLLGLLLVLDLASVFLSSGIVFGWAPFNAILIEEGFYASLCTDSAQPPPCEAQANALNLAFTIGSTAVSFVAVPAGMLVDSFGPAVGTLVAGIIEISGLIGIALCEPVWRATGFDLFLVSVVLIAIGGSLTMFNAYSTPFLFKRRMNVVVELTACLFDGSCIIFTFFKLAYEAGVPFNMLWWGFVGLAAAVYSLLLLAWVLNAKQLQASRGGRGDDAATLDTALADAGEASAPESTPTELAAKPLLQQVRSLEFATVCLFATVQVTAASAVPWINCNPSLFCP